MKFAVVEYSSKSGDIWHAAPDKPNYLEDPAKVIDPTSFGCYVSALAGEHIPLLKFLGQNQFWPRVVKKISGSWPQNYDLSYFSNFDVLLVVHQISDAHELARFVHRLKKAYPRVFIVGVPTQPYGLLRPHIDSHHKARQDFIHYLNGCDLFLSVVASTQDWYQSLTQTPVVYLPQIYPTHFASQHFTPRPNKENSIFVAGITDRPNIAQGLRVAAALQQEFPNFAIRITQIPEVKMDFSHLKDARYEAVPFKAWRAHLPWLAKQYLVINTDYTRTRGRVQVDSAAVGTPSLGGNSDGQIDLFPSLASNPKTTDQELVNLGIRLLSDSKFYDEISHTAAEKLKKYDYEESAARLMMLVKSHRQ